MSKFRGSAKWKADTPRRTNTGASIRGKTISHPIPFADDDEFPIREPGTGIATPLGTEGIEKQLHSRASPVTRPRSSVQSDKISEAGLEESTPERTPSVPPQPSYSPPAPPHIQPSPLRNSITSVPSGSNEGKPQRKKSSLKSVFGRLFGKKQRNGSASGPRAQGPSSVRAGQHRSVSILPSQRNTTNICQDPTALNKTSKGAALSQQRSASLPINEFNRALRSHSTATATEDFPAVDIDDEKRESLQIEGQTRPRRATTPSRLWTPDRTLGYVDLGLSPRPASTQARGSKLIADEDVEAPIGVAVTSGSHPNRRSRSLGELRGGVPTKSITRRRSDEIRYWRESYDPGLRSPMSSNKAETEEPILMDDPEVPHKEENEEPPQPFNFGPMGEMAGMKITQAASLETRVLRLERRMHDMEKAIYRMHSRAEPPTLRDPPKRISRRDRSSSAARPRTDDSEPSLPNQQRYRGVQQTHAIGSQIRSSSYGASRPSTTSTSNSYRPSLENVSPPFFEQSSFAPAQNSARPLSTSTTIRGIPSSSPTMPKDGTLTHEHYTTLTNMILAEQSARQHLESLVHTLQQELQSLRSTPLVSNLQHLTSIKKIPGSEAGEFSIFEQDDSDDEDGRFGNEDFQTPSEERDLGDEPFGGGLGEGERKGAPRTLSLSQMTLGRGVSSSMNF